MTLVGAFFFTTKHCFQTLYLQAENSDLQHHILHQEVVHVLVVTWRRKHWRPSQQPCPFGPCLSKLDLMTASMLLWTVF